MSLETNQGISNDVTNKNVGIYNDAELKNLQLADTQFVRQSEAKSRTREINQALVNSVNSKYLQNDQNNKTLQAYENLYDYRFNQDNNGHADYVGGNAAFNWNSVNNGANTNEYSRTVTETDPAGNVTKRRIVTPSQQTIRAQELLNQQRSQNVSPNRKFFKRIFGR